MDYSYIQLLDKEQDMFYSELLSGYTCWVLPEGTDIASVKHVTYMADNGLPYFENVLSGEVTWSLPAEEMTPESVAIVQNLLTQSRAELEATLETPYDEAQSAIQTAALDAYIESLGAAAAGGVETTLATNNFDEGTAENNYSYDPPPVPVAQPEPEYEELEPPVYEQPVAEIISESGIYEEKAPLNENNQQDLAIETEAAEEEEVEQSSVTSSYLSPPSYAAPVPPPSVPPPQPPVPASQPPVDDSDTEDNEEGEVEQEVDEAEEEVEEEEDVDVVSSNRETLSAVAPALKTIESMKKTVIKSGFLNKLAKVSGRNWKKRFFILNPYHLAYYESNRTANTKPKGEIQIDGESTVAIDPSVSLKQGYGFVITNSYESMTIAASTEIERDEWTTALWNIIRYAKTYLKETLSLIQTTTVVKSTGFSSFFGGGGSNTGESTTVTTAVNKYFILSKGLLTYHPDFKTTSEVEGIMNLNTSTIIESMDDVLFIITLVDSDVANTRMSFQFVYNERLYKVWKEQILKYCEQSDPNLPRPEIKRVLPVDANAPAAPTSPPPSMSQQDRLQSIFPTVPSLPPPSNAWLGNVSESDGEDDDDENESCDIHKPLPSITSPIRPPVIPAPTPSSGLQKSSLHSLFPSADKVIAAPVVSPVPPARHTSIGSDSSTSLPFGLPPEKVIQAPMAAPPAPPSGAVRRQTVGRFQFDLSALTTTEEEVPGDSHISSTQSAAAVTTTTTATATTAAAATTAPEAEMGAEPATTTQQSHTFTTESLQYSEIDPNDYYREQAEERAAAAAIAAITAEEEAVKLAQTQQQQQHKHRQEDIMELEDEEEQQAGQLNNNWLGFAATASQSDDDEGYDVKAPAAAIIRQPVEPARMTLSTQSKDTGGVLLGKMFNDTGNKPTVRVVFDTYANEKQTIDVRTLHSLCYDFGVYYSMSEIKAMVRTYSTAYVSGGATGSNLYLSYDDFMVWWRNQEQFSALKLTDPAFKRRHQCAQLFKQYDTILEGSVDLADFHDICRELIEKKVIAKGTDLSQVLERLEADSRGEVDFNRFIAWIDSLDANGNSKSGAFSSGLFKSFSRSNSSNVSAASQKSDQLVSKPPVPNAAPKAKALTVENLPHDNMLRPPLPSSDFIPLHTVDYDDDNCDAISALTGNTDAGFSGHNTPTNGSSKPYNFANYSEESVQPPEHMNALERMQWRKAQKTLSSHGSPSQNKSQSNVFNLQQKKEELFSPPPPPPPPMSDLPRSQHRHRTYTLDDELAAVSIEDADKMVGGTGGGVGRGGFGGEGGGVFGVSLGDTDSDDGEEEEEVKPKVKSLPSKNSATVPPPPAPATTKTEVSNKPATSATTTAGRKKLKFRSAGVAIKEVSNSAVVVTAEDTVNNAGDIAAETDDESQQPKATPRSGYVNPIARLKAAKAATTIDLGASTLSTAGKPNPPAPGPRPHPPSGPVSSVPAPPPPAPLKVNSPKMNAATQLSSDNNSIAGSKNGGFSPMRTKPLIALSTKPGQFTQSQQSSTSPFAVSSHHQLNMRSNQDFAHDTLHAIGAAENRIQSLIPNPGTYKVSAVTSPSAIDPDDREQVQLVTYQLLLKERQTISKALKDLQTKEQQSLQRLQEEEYYSRQKLEFAREKSIFEISEAERLLKQQVYDFNQKILADSAALDKLHKEFARDKLAYEAQAKQNLDFITNVAKQLSDQHAVLMEERQKLFKQRSTLDVTLQSLHNVMHPESASQYTALLAQKKLQKQSDHIDLYHHHRSSFSNNPQADVSYGAEDYTQHMQTMHQQPHSTVQQSQPYYYQNSNHNNNYIRAITEQKYDSLIPGQGLPSGLSPQFPPYRTSSPPNQSMVHSGGLSAYDMRREQQQYQPLRQHQPYGMQQQPRSQSPPGRNTVQINNRRQGRVPPPPQPPQQQQIQQQPGMAGGVMSLSSMLKKHRVEGGSSVGSSRSRDPSPFSGGNRAVAGGRLVNSKSAVIGANGGRKTMSKPVFR